MQVKKEILKDVVENVIYPVEELLRKELQKNGYSEERSIEYLKEVGLLKIALLPILENINIEDIKQNLINVEKLHNFPLDSGYIKELLGYFFDLLRDFMKTRSLGEIIRNEKFCEIFSYLKSGNDIEDQSIEDDEFLDFSEDQDNDINNIHYEDYEKISANEYMESSYIDFDLLEDILELLERYEKIRYMYDFFCDEFKYEVNEILKRFFTLFELSGEFRTMSKGIENLIYILNSLKTEEIENTNKKILKLFLDTIMDDLATWYREVIELRTANNIHYFDVSLLSNIQQIVQIFGKQSND